MAARARITYVDATADLQAAIDAAPAGSTLFLGPGTFTAPSGALGLSVTKSIAIEGVSQPSDYDTAYSDATRLRMGTIIQAYAANGSNPIFTVNPGAAISGQSQLSFKLKNVVLDGRATGLHAGGYGVYSHRADGDKLETCEFDNVVVINTGDTGIVLDRVASPVNDSALVGLFCHRLFIHSCYGRGMYVLDATQASFRDSIFLLNNYTGLYLDTVGVSFDNCGWESNGATYDPALDGTPDSTNARYNQAQCSLNNCNHVTMRGHHFENFDGAARNGVAYNAANDKYSRIGLYLNNCDAIEICSGGLFTNTTYDGNTHGDLWRNWSQNPDGTAGSSANTDTTTNSAIKVFQCRNFILGSQWLRHCYVGVNVAPSGASDHQYTPGRIANQIIYDVGGYGCNIPYIGVSGEKMLMMDPTYAEALPPEAGSALGFIQNTGGIQYWDMANSRMRQFNGASWTNVVAGEIVYEGDVVTYDDEILLS